MGIYSQGYDEDRLKIAMSSAAEMFIVACYGKDILGKVLRDRGMTQASGRRTAIGATEFITVGTAAEFGAHYEKAFEVNVPIELIAAQQVAAACLQ